MFRVVHPIMKEIHLGAISLETNMVYLYGDFISTLLHDRCHVTTQLHLICHKLLALHTDIKYPFVEQDKPHPSLTILAQDHKRRAHPFKICFAFIEEKSRKLGVVICHMSMNVHSRSVIWVFLACKKSRHDTLIHRIIISQGPWSLSIKKCLRLFFYHLYQKVCT